MTSKYDRSKRQNNRPADYESNYEYEVKDPKGNREGDGRRTIYGLSSKPLKMLPKSSYSFQVDPYTAAMPAATPYTILNRFNPIIGGNYKGDRNLDGGNTSQYVTSVSSGFLKYFDFARTSVNFNYRYLPINKNIAQNVGTSEDPRYVGEELVNEMRRSISEAVSLLQASTFTEMAIYNYVVEAPDLVMGSAQLSDLTINGNTVKVYRELPDVIYASSIYYQVFLQSMLQVLNAHNSYRLKMGTMIRSSWNRETPQLNALFGLFKKKSFISLLESLNLSFPGEFVDTEWMYQTNMITTTPSRRSNSITDPVLEVTGLHNQIGAFRLHIVNPSNGAYISTVYDSSTDASSIVEGSVLALPAMCAELVTRLSAQDTMTWARSQSSTTNATSRFNRVKYLIDGLTDIMTSFKTKMNDVRECYDVLSRIGLVTWVKGFKPSIVKDTDAPLSRNLTTEDIFKIAMSGPTEVRFNPTTYRWRSYSLWDMYSGIPEYDAKSGGAFLTFSLKRIVADEGAADTLGYLPVALSGLTSCLLTSRDGVEASVSALEMTMSTDAVLSRLVPLVTQSDLKIRIPVLSNDQTGITTLHKSTIYKTMTQIFGMCGVYLGTSNLPDIALDPDIVAIYELEVEDITNEAITYARANAPFRGATEDDGLLGFFGSSGAERK